MFEGIDFNLIESFDSEEGFTDFCIECSQEVLMCDCDRIFMNAFKLNEEEIYNG